MAKRKPVYTEGDYLSVANAAMKIYNEQHIPMAEANIGIFAAMVKPSFPRLPVDTIKYIINKVITGEDVEESATPSPAPAALAAATTARAPVAAAAPASVTSRSYQSVSPDEMFQRSLREAEEISLAEMRSKAEYEYQQKLKAAAEARSQLDQTMAMVLEYTQSSDLVPAFSEAHAFSHSRAALVFGSGGSRSLPDSLPPREVREHKEHKMQHQPASGAHSSLTATFPARHEACLREELQKVQLRFDEQLDLAIAISSMENLDLETQLLGR